MQACLYPIGIYAHLLLDGVNDTDLIVPTLLNDTSVFPLWAADFLFVAIVAAAMSSIDGVLLVAASTGYKNVLAPFSNAAKPLLWTRVAVVASRSLGVSRIGAIKIFCKSQFSPAVFTRRASFLLWYWVCIGARAMR